MIYFIYYASFIVVLPGILFALICQILVSTRFKKYSRGQSASQWTANEMSDMLLEKQGIRSVEIRRIGGSLTDNYNPSTDVLSLSESVYSGTDIASLGVAAHECGHAVQKHTGSFLLTLRSILVPVTNIGSRLAVPVAAVGVLLSFFVKNPNTADVIIAIGIALYSLSTLFALVTLPVEFNASHRAMDYLSGVGVVSAERKGAFNVLRACALTYVAAALISVLQILWLLSQREE